MDGRIRSLLLLALAASLVVALPLYAQDLDVAEDQDLELEAGLITLEPADSADHGAEISLDVQAAEIATVLRSLASFSGTNIVASPRVTGKVTVRLEQVPWREALTVILRAHNFDYVEEHGIIRVDTADDLRQETVAVKMAAKQIDELEKLTLGLATLQYANAQEVKDSLEQMLTQRGNIDVDVRTNSLLINDIAERVALIQAMATQLDTQTPQVEINARLVDMDARASRELGVSWSLANFQPDGANVAGDIAINNQLQEPAGRLRVGTVQNYGELVGQLDALERQNLAHLISNPVITTTDNREASILVGQKIPLIVADEAGNAVTQLTTIGIMLKVTPHINSPERITLDVHNEVSDLSSQATVQGGVIINTSESDTRVMVRNGETAIIAGLIRSVEGRLVSGIPVLKDLPLLGALFRHETTTNDGRELVIFVTPRLVTDEYLVRDQLSSQSTIRMDADGDVDYGD
ncbi:MAG TPA: secretin N-terminal domain-containing protein [Candidatus Krumholzibacteria bacterium]|nr:secretin N-terminal domain-containing protein [Candidatus Krumholzibacteria bacterium]HPD71468.1 secretin N-terminal domain-containing protein [Candidatus Krumholzibacteria bacterium]HRY41599.1 secretin N-terminal domain-containing protein [Candidatus Krumholzibacteria bacterium]